MSWDDFRKEFVKQLPADGTGFCVLSEASSSPSFARHAGRIAEEVP